MDENSAKELLSGMIDCAKKTGIYDKMFLGFGTLLGAIRENGLISHDDDMDICFLPMEPKKKHEYLNACVEAGLMNGWPDRKKRIALGKDLLWFSAKKGEKEVKSCNWFFFPYDEKYWHSKGKAWVSDLSFSPKLKYKPTDEGIALGIDSSFFKDFVEINFLGFNILVPKLAGTICDEYYPNWFYPKEGGSSDQKKIISIEDWGYPLTWRYLKNE